MLTENQPIMFTIIHRADNYLYSYTHSQHS